jgi:hypothetical protein
MSKYVPYIVIAVLVMLLTIKCNEPPEIVEVPVEVTVEVPAIPVEHDTIKLPAEVITLPGKVEIDSTYYYLYKELADKEKDSLFKDAITIREYKETIEDDTLKIDLYNKVRGKLLEYQVGYIVKPRTITVDTIIPVKIKKKAELYFGAFSSYQTELGHFGIGPEATLINVKHTKAYDLGYDIPNKEVTFGVKLRF